MKIPAINSRAGAIGLALAFLVIGQTAIQAQTPVAIPPPKAAGPDDLSQAELLKSYWNVREQLHAAELAIANNRLESEATARAQAATIAEKLDAIKGLIAAEREQLQNETQRAAADQERQRLAAEESNRFILWMAAALGAGGLAAMLATTLLQWRGIKLITQVTAHSQQLAVPAQSGWWPLGHDAPSGETIALSNQRMMAVIDRMERRILELEHTAVTPPAPVTGEAEPPAAPLRKPPAPVDQAARIVALLGKGHSLVNANKAREAIACYDEILTIDPTHVDALVKKGAALERLKQDREAIECYDRAIQADGNTVLAYLSMGGIYNRLQRFDEAVECYEQALRVELESRQTGIRRVSVSKDGQAPAVAIKAG